jgi:hypothetical protein
MILKQQMFYQLGVFFHCGKPFFEEFETEAEMMEFIPQEYRQ